MGWVVYDKSGRLIKYYKKPGPAKSAVTKYHKAIADGGYQWPEAYACCSYRDFEGVLLGLRGAELKMWQFCNTQTT
jgi:hypothetical protein